MFWKEKEKKIRRIRNNQFTNEIKNSRISFALFVNRRKEEKKLVESGISRMENMLFMT